MADLYALRQHDSFPASAWEFKHSILKSRSMQRNVEFSKSAFSQGARVQYMIFQVGNRFRRSETAESVQCKYFSGFNPQFIADFYL